MIQIFQKKNGAVSVFLSIVLVPMMVIASIMIDYGRVQLGKAMAASAGDLTLNTALTEYDNVLKDVYGLMATSQNNDELLEKLEDYYTSSIVAQGVSKADANDYVGQIMDSIKNTSGSSSVDFMNMGNIEFSVEEPKTASLVNPALLRGQIVNFMKYRGPINGGMSLLESLKSFSHLSKQMEIVENKQKYYDEHASLLENCEKAWGYMAKYVALFNKKEDFESIKTDMEGMISNYKDINSKVIHNYYNNMPTKYFSKPVTCYCENGKWILNYDDGQAVSVSTYYADKKSKNSKYVPKESELAESVKALVEYLNTNPKFTDIAAKYGGGDKYPIQVATQANINKNIDFQSYKNLYIAYTNFADIYNVLSEDDKTKSTVEITEKKIGNIVNYTYKVKLNSNNNSEENNSEENNSEDNSNTNQNVTVTTKLLSEYYNEINVLFEEKMKSLSNGTYTIFWNYASYESEYNSNYADANKKVSDISKKAAGYKEKLGKAKKHLENCRDELQKIADKVNPAGGSNLQQALNTWNKSASDASVSNDAIAQQDKAEIEQMKQFIKYDDVKKLLDRVNNAITEIDNNIKEIGKYTYCKTFIGDIDALNTFKNKLSAAEGGNLSNLSMVTSTLDTLSEDIAKRQIQRGNIKADWSGQSDKNPVFSEDQYRFYTYLYNNYHSKTDTQNEDDEVNSKSTSDGKKTAENKKNDIKNIGESTKDDAKKGNSVSSKSIEDYYKNITAPSKSELYNGIISDAYNVPSIGDDAADKGNTSSGLSSMFSKLSDALKNAAVDLRDYIFIEEYIMNMFSYNTYEAEINEKIEEDKDKGNDTNDTLADRAKTLTNVPINANNNYSYLQEVEYIIYGNNGTTKTYTTIFGIRLAMNCIYAFTDTELRNGAYAIAASIFSVPPLTPLIPVAQNGILLAVAVAESGLDLAQLKKGKAVALIKDKDTWCISFDKLIVFLKTEVKDKAVDVIRDGIDDISDNVKGKINEWLDYSEEELKNKVSDSSSELTDLVSQLEQNVNQEVERYVGVVINELTTLCTKANDMLMYNEDDKGNKITEDNKDQIRLDYIKRNLESWWNGEKVNMDTSTLAYKIEEETIKYLLNSADADITEIFNSASQTVSDMGDALKGKISTLSESISTAVKNTSTEINEYISGLKTKLQESANKGIDAFRDELNNGISNLFGTGKGDSDSLDIDKSNTSSIASMFKFRYSDYLRVFLMVALVGNSNNVMAKTSDILEANMSKITGTTFKLEKSYTYIKINAEVDVKPLLLTLPWMNDTTQKYVGGKNYYRVSYTGISGY